MQSSTLFHGGPVEMTFDAAGELERLLTDFDQGANAASGSLTTISASHRRLARSVQAGANPRSQDSVTAILRACSSHPARASESPFDFAKGALLALDEAARYQSLQPVFLTKETVLFGRRWWSPDASKAGERPGVKWDSQWRFAYVRRVPVADIQVLSIPPEALEAGKLLAGATEIKVGLLTLSGVHRSTFAPTRVVVEGEQMGFKAASIMSARASTAAVSDYLLELRGCVREAISQGAHLIVLPEYCVSPEGREAIRSEIEQDAGDLLLIVPGSFSEELGDGTYGNVAPVWVVTDRGKVISVGRHLKRVPARYPVTPDMAEDCGLSELATKAAEARCGEIIEDLGVTALLPLVLTPVGAVAVAICSDLLDPKSKILQLHGLVDQLIVPSMNDGSTILFQSAQEAATRFFLAGYFYVNSAQIGSSAVEMAIASVPGRSAPRIVCSARQVTCLGSSSWVPYSQVQEAGGILVLSNPIPNRIS